MRIAASRGADGEKQRIFFGENRGERGWRRGIEIGLVGAGNSISCVERGKDFPAAGVEILLLLALPLDENEHFIRIGIGDVADALDLGIAKPLGGEAAAEPVNIRRLGEADIHVGTAFEVDPVANPASEKNRSPPSEEKNTAQGIEILGFAHPVDIGLFEELNHADFASPP